MKQIVLILLFAPFWACAQTIDSTKTKTPPPAWRVEYPEGFGGRIVVTIPPQRPIANIKKRRNEYARVSK